ncbi:MAG TPA: hypothetical protein QGH03_00310 [Candidatus Paceibacterota bacterium]|jgi:type II secretory pathway pseudopilin PulG|nr:hypothetical protein [Parcubacteria group bacterium]MDP6119355.1 hypothetical protein [Candidatus Paceibacterota bacterium]HJN62669.1 hypothetical protein [Candidatus Paceibacterota bacterium]|tara:strand:- start:269 stop:805 length:537 start_codon:yes stop_codon:yes gene_type:complete
MIFSKAKRNRGFTPTPFCKKGMGSQSKRGISLIEVIIGTSIILIAFIGLVATYNLFLEMALKNTQKIQSAYLLEEGLEAIRSVRDDSWDNNIATLATDISYGLSFDGSDWGINLNPSMIDNEFYREFSVENVYRDINDDIASSGTLDSRTKFFIVSVSWIEGGATTTKSISSYLSKIF